MRQIAYAGGNFEQTCYNNRLQVAGILLRTSAPAGECTDANNLWKLDLGYGTANNGNLVSQTISGGTWTAAQTFTYDKLNRLLTAEEPGGQGWKRHFGYDRWGNQWVDESDSYGIDIDSVTPKTSSWITAKNRLNLPTGSYNRAGNLTSIGPNAVLYDAEGRMASIGSIVYGYDGEGRRVKRTHGATTLYVYDAFGQLAAEYTSGALAVANCSTCFVTTDHLGSTRALWDMTGVKARFDHMPFGELIPADRNGRSTLSCAPRA